PGPKTTTRRRTRSTASKSTSGSKEAETASPQTEGPETDADATAESKPRSRTRTRTRTRAGTATKEASGQQTPVKEAPARGRGRLRRGDRRPGPSDRTRAEERTERHRPGDQGSHRGQGGPPHPGDQPAGALRGLRAEIPDLRHQQATAGRRAPPPEGDPEEDS